MMAEWWRRSFKIRLNDYVVRNVPMVIIDKWVNDNLTIETVPYADFSYHFYNDVYAALFKMRWG